MPKHRKGAYVALALAWLPSSSQARPFTVEDLLREEQVTNRLIDPSGRWLLIEQTDPYATAPRFDDDLQSRLRLSRLSVMDLSRPATARPLMPGETGRGVTSAGFSPTGVRLAVQRFKGARRTLGVVTMATGAVRWFDVTPEWSASGRTLQWRDDNHLLVIDRPDGTLNFTLREGHASADRLPNLWAASARGEVGNTVIGSGRYAADRPRSGARRLLDIDVTTGAIERLATGEFTDLELSPNGKTVAILEAGEDVQPLKDGPSQGDWGTSSPVSDLVLLDLKTGTRRSPCPGRNVLPMLLDWSPSGRALLVLARRPSTGWSTAELVRIDATDGSATGMAESLQPALRLRPEVVWAGWMGEDPILLARVKNGAGDRLDWYRLAAGGPVNLTRDLPTAASDLSALGDWGMDLLVAGVPWRVDKYGKATPLGAEPVSPVHTPRPAAGRLDVMAPDASFVVSSHAGHRAVQRIDAAGLHRLVDLTSDDGVVVDASAPHAAAVLKMVDAHRVERTKVVGVTAAPIDVGQINSRLAEVDPETVLPVHHRGPEGQALTSWLFLPRAVPGAAPAPLIVQVYSGNTYAKPPQALPGVIGFATDERMLIGHGYAVLIPSLPLPAGVNDPMVALGPRIAAIVDAVEALPEIDRSVDVSRAALWGHSYGGYTVMAAIGQTSRFKAAIAISGISDMTAMWATLPVAHRAAPEEGSWSNWNTGNTESGQNRMGSPPWRDPARYDRNSPLLAADRIETPLLMIHGDQDFIPLASSEAMFSALYRQDKDAQLVTYWGEGHYLGSPGNIRDFYRRAFAFLDEHLRAGLTDGASARSPNPGSGSASGAPKPQP